MRACGSAKSRIALLAVKAPKMLSKQEVLVSRAWSLSGSRSFRSALLASILISKVASFGSRKANSKIIRRISVENLLSVPRD